MKRTTRLSIHTTSILMLITATIYFLAAYLEASEDVSEHAVQIEIILFAVIGITYVPLGVWMLKNRLNSRAPYVISVVISVALIGLYVAAKTISLPITGLERDVGIIDVTSKVLQVAIVIISIILLPQLKKNQSYEIHQNTK